MEAGWPRDAALVRLPLSRIKARSLPQHDSPASPAAYALLLRPRAWVRELADCVMAERGLVPGRFISVHVRSSPEKAAELSRYGVTAPPATALHSLSLALGKRLQLRDLFVRDQIGERRVGAGEERIGRQPGRLQRLKRI